MQRDYSGGTIEDLLGIVSKQISGDWRATTSAVNFPIMVREDWT